MPAPPTVRQLRHLRRLAQRTGTTFTQPTTKAEASRAIEALTARPFSSKVERYLDGERTLAERRGAHDATAVTDDEISGQGSSARWRHGSQS